jgi:hypothetical protein
VQVECFWAFSIVVLQLLTCARSRAPIRGNIGSRLPKPNSLEWAMSKSWKVLEGDSRNRSAQAGNSVGSADDIVRATGFNRRGTNDCLPRSHRLTKAGNSITADRKKADHRHQEAFDVGTRTLFWARLAVLAAVVVPVVLALISQFPFSKLMPARIDKASPPHTSKRQRRQPRRRNRRQVPTAPRHHQNQQQQRNRQ